MGVLYVAKRATGGNIVNKQELKILMGGRGTKGPPESRCYCCCKG